MKSRRALVRLAPWLIALAVTGALLLRYSPGAIAQEIARGDSLATLPWVIAVALVSLAVMVVADWSMFSAALGRARLDLVSVLRGRAAAWVLMSLGYGFSGAGYGVWLARRSGAGATRAVSALAQQMLADLSAVFWFALVSLPLAGAIVPERARAPIVLAAALGALGTSAILFFGHAVAPRRFRESRAVSAWRAVGRWRLAASLALRVVALLVNVVGSWAAARAFGLDVPFGAMAAGLPIVYLVGALPFNVAGLGPVSAAWVVVFDRWAPAAELLAFQFVYQMLSTAMVVARGLPFLPSVMRDINVPSPTTNEPATPGSTPAPPAGAA